MQLNDLPPECIAVGICPYLNSRVKMSDPLKRIKCSHDLTIEPLSASTGVSAIGKRNRAFDGPELADRDRSATDRWLCYADAPGCTRSRRIGSRERPAGIG
jgi:hypothetical protein